MTNFGFLNINKQQGVTSHDVVARLRRILKIKQIGHTGTLDPLASGVLPIAIGKATRLIEFIDDGKAYKADLIFGKISDSYDTEGNIVDFSTKVVSQKDIESALENFQGEIEQIPPAYSAIHYNGKRLYELARQGTIPEDIPKRKVFIEQIKLLSFDETTQHAQLYVSCSKGTYIRSIIHDLGQLLECGAIMSGLTRVKSGKFTIENAVTITETTTAEELHKRLINPIEVLSYKCYQLSDLELSKVKHGQSLSVDKFTNGEYLSLTHSSKLCAIAIANQDSKKLTVKKVFV